MDNTTLIQKFFDQEKNYQRNGNLFFEKNVLYSYGYHFPLCLVHNKLSIINSTRYSSTTNKHQSIARSIASDFIELENSLMKRLVDSKNNISQEILTCQIISTTEKMKLEKYNYKKAKQNRTKKRFLNNFIDLKNKLRKLQDQ